MFTFLAGLLLVCATLCYGENATFPQFFEIDLVFPRNDTTYAPTNAFPFVFAVQNAGTAWPIGLEIAVDISPFSDAGIEDGGDAFHLGGSDGGFTSGNASTNPSLLIGTTNIITNTTERQFSIMWHYILDNTCGDHYGRGYVSEYMHISFSTSLSGATPDVAAAVKSCPSQFSLVEVDRNSNTSIYDANGKRCTSDVFSKNGTRGGDPCALRPLAQTIAANVSAAMCVAENGTRACESTAGLRLIHSGLGVSSLLVLAATISALCLSL